MADKFKCPTCGSGRTKPLSVAISGGTRRRSAVGLSRRSIWGSSSTYKSDFVSSLPERPSNAGAYISILLGVCGLLFAILVGSGDNQGGVTAAIVVISVLFIVFGIAAKKPTGQLVEAQATWDRRWVCARCGRQWET
jgi:hypothetical protein